MKIQETLSLKNIFSPPFYEHLCRIEDFFLSQGTSAYIVGGAVRDALLTGTLSEVDWAVSHFPCDCEGFFSKILSVGKTFGVYRVQYEGIFYDVAQFRGEKEYVDGRRPSETFPVRSIEDDAQRRDFTVNALYYSPLQDKIFDPLQTALNDLEARVLCAIGKPEERFQEDHLRILRFARFALTHALTPDEITLQKAWEFLHLLHRVSRERIREEWIKWLKKYDGLALSPHKQFLEGIFFSSIGCSIPFSFNKRVESFPGENKKSGKRKRASWEMVPFFSNIRDTFLRVGSIAHAIFSLCFGEDSPIFFLEKLDQSILLSREEIRLKRKLMVFLKSMEKMTQENVSPQHDIVLIQKLLHYLKSDTSEIREAWVIYNLFDAELYWYIYTIFSFLGEEVPHYWAGLKRHTFYSDFIKGNFRVDMVEEINRQWKKKFALNFLIQDDKRLTQSFEEGTSFVRNTLRDHDLKAFDDFIRSISADTHVWVNDKILYSLFLVYFSLKKSDTYTRTSI